MTSLKRGVMSLQQGLLRTLSSVNVTSLHSANGYHRFKETAASILKEVLNMLYQTKRRRIPENHVMKNRFK